MNPRLPAPITLRLALTRPPAVTPSPNVLAVAAMFGLGVDESRSIEIIPPTELTLAPGQILFITGPSGGGKTSILRLIAQSARQHPNAPRVIDMNTISPANTPIVDLFPNAPLAHALALLSAAGLSDAFVLLRSPAELSDGQRYRLQLALALHAALEPQPNHALQSPAPPLTLLLADEFGATLDRVTAAVLARSLRRWTRRHPQICFIAATTHDDLLEPLEPDVLIHKPLGAGVSVLSREK